MAELARRVNELERDLLKVTTRGVNLVRLADRENTLLHTRAAALDHDEVILDNTVVRETAHRGDRLLRRVELSRTRFLVKTVTDTEDLLVQLRTVVVAILTRASDREHNVGRVPSTNAGHLAQTTVSLARQLLGTPTGGHTLITLTLGNTDDVDVFILGEQAVHVNSLFKETMCELNLVGNRAAVDLDLHKMSLLLLQARVTQLSVGKDTNNRAVLANTLKLTSDRLTVVLRVLLGVLGERLLLAAVPVLVEATLHLVREMLGPHRRQRAETTRCLNVADNTNDHHRRGLDNRCSLDNLALVKLRSRTVEVTNNVSHTSLVAHEGGQVNRLLGVILRERLDLTAVARGTLAGKEAKRAVTRVLKLYCVSTSVYHGASCTLTLQ